MFINNISNHNGADVSFIIMIAIPVAPPSKMVLGIIKHSKAKAPMTFPIKSIINVTNVFTFLLVILDTLSTPLLC